MKEQIVCPKCHSDQISANKKGFSGTNAAIGNIIGGDNYGTQLGMTGSDRTIITCLKCGNKFSPGYGAIKTIDDTGNETIVYQKKKGSPVALIIVLVVMVFALYKCLAH